MKVTDTMVAAAMFEQRLATREGAPVEAAVRRMLEAALVETPSPVQQQYRDALFNPKHWGGVGSW